MKLKLFVFPSTTNCQGMVTAYSTLQDKKPIIAGKLISSSYTNAAMQGARGNTKTSVI